MTAPKEKAKELIEKFMKPIDGLHKYPMCFDTAKECSLISVYEILEMDLPILEEATDGFYDYWEKVRDELNKLEQNEK